jgi:hypothetical protein
VLKPDEAVKDAANSAVVSKNPSSPKITDL